MEEFMFILLYFAVFIISISVFMFGTVIVKNGIDTLHFSNKSREYTLRVRTVLFCMFVVIYIIVLCYLFFITIDWMYQLNTTPYAIAPEY
jgi:cytochrome c biogenesis factor